MTHPLPLSYYNRSRRRRSIKLKGIILLTTIFILILLPGGSTAFSAEEEEPEGAGLGLEAESIPKESSLLRLARLSEMELSPPVLPNASHHPSQSSPRNGDHTIEKNADHNHAYPRNSETEEYIIEDPPFHGKKCDSDKQCYQLFGKSLECRDGTCQCMVWNDIKLIWTSKGNICLGAVGHPCATKTMCHSEKCEKGHCVSGGHSQRPLPPNRSLITEIVIHISVLIVARFVLRNGV